MQAKKQQDNYYKDELKKINACTLYSPSFKFKNTDTDEPAETKWMQLNKESAKALLDYIKTNFPNLK